MVSNSPILQFTNCNILRDHKIITDDLWVRNGKIIDPEKIFFDEKKIANECFDCKGALICPGFIDIQINGGFGVDFSYDVDSTEDNVDKVAKGILAHGVTSFCPTLVTSQPEVYRKVLPRIPPRPGGKHGATVLGVHCEGPFINVNKKGAHDEKSIASLLKGVAALEEVYGCLDNICIVTLAPELPGALETIKHIRKRNINVSIGHSAGNLQDGLNAVKLGTRLITHLFNAMLPFHHRDPGLVGLLSSDLPENAKIYYGIIADGVHTHPAALRIAHRTHPEGLIVVTDAVSALGLQEGRHHVGKMCVEVRGGCAYIAGSDTLCGSIASMIECVRILKAATGCSLVEALEAASLHPAEALGLNPQKGTLNFGADADFVVLSPDEGLQVRSTWIGGQRAYYAC